ncbi:MAG: NAD-dependent epimerase/dehydratase family protein [Pseudomonadota bacterium]
MDISAPLRVFVTGGLGFIGSSLIASLAKNHGPQIEVVVLDNFSSGSVQGLADTLGITASEPAFDDDDSLQLENILLYRGDVRDENRVQEAMGHADIIVHLAAHCSVPDSIKDPVRDFEYNVIGLFNVLNAARRLETRPKIVFSSTNALLGDAQQPVSEATLPSPISPYGASKMASEAYLQAFSASYGLPSVVLRFGNAYGPGSYASPNVVARFVRRALNGEALEVFGDGSQTRDFIYIDDLTEAIEKAMFYSVEGFELFQISSGIETDVASIAAGVCDAVRATGFDAPDLVFGTEREGDMPRNVSDVSKAREQLDWHAKTELKDGLARTVEAFLRHRQRKAQ